MEDRNILETPEYLELLLTVANGYNYASKIALYFSEEGKIIGHGKKQPTITEQLHTLEKYDLIRKKEYSKAKLYEINWDPIIKTFYHIVDAALNDITYVFGAKDSKKLKKIGLQNILPNDFIRDFFSLHGESLTIGIIAVKHKGLSELVLGFFSAILKLDKKELDKLVKRYSINRQGLLEISNFISKYSYFHESHTLEHINVVTNESKTEDADNKIHKGYDK